MTESHDYIPCHNLDGGHTSLGIVLALIRIKSNRVDVGHVNSKRPARRFRDATTFVRWLNNFVRGGYRSTDFDRSGRGGAFALAMSAAEI